MDGVAPPSLLPGERVEWSGRPGRGLLFVPSDLFVVPFTFVWCAGVLGIVTAGGTSFLHQPFPFMLIPFLFVVIGAFISVGRFALDIWLRSRTRYVVTDRRVLIDRDPPFGQSLVVVLAGLYDLRLHRGRGGRGTISLGPSPSFFAYRGFGAMVPSLSPTPQLLRIDEAEAVYAKLQRLIDRQTGQSAFS